MPRPSPLRSMMRLVARGVQARGTQAPEWELGGPRRKVALERADIHVDPAHVRAYARATAGEGIAAFRTPGLVAPPFFPATWEVGLTLEMLAGLETPLPLGPMVHVSTEMVWMRPLPAGEAVRCRVELDRVERVKRGLRLTVLARNWLGAGQLCCQGTTVFMLRMRPPADGVRLPEPPLESDEAQPPVDGWAELGHWELPAGEGRRYARVSGDYNPIHLWPWTARPFGFRAPILHGFATAARAAHGIIEQRLHGDASALRRMRITFRAPLPLPGAAALRVHDAGPERWFRVAAPGEGPVYAEGTYGAAAPT
jgi:acyl dehydratase